LKTRASSSTKTNTKDSHKMILPSKPSLVPSILNPNYRSINLSWKKSPKKVSTQSKTQSL
jgi:hypothetical protein